MIQLDADDELLPHSISFLVDTYFSIPEEIRENYWCVHGRCVTQFGEFVGTPYPDGINSLHWKSAGDVASKCVGEKIGLQVTKYLSEYKFPSVVGVSYIPEIIVWRQLNLKYGTWYTNEVVRTYYVNEGGNLSAKRTKRHQYGPLAFYHKWRLTHPDQFTRSAKDFIYYSIIYFVSTYKYRKNNPYFKDIKSWVDKILLALLVPVTLPMSWIFRLLKHIK
jgi:hypothetical protein